jgi:hypothetical protein
MTDVVQRMIQLHPAPLVDFMGNRVSKFVKHVDLCEEFKCHWRLILIDRSFTNQHPKFLESRRFFCQMFLQLSELCVWNGFYQQAEHFQLEIAETIRGG